MIEQKQQPPKETTDEQKLCYIASQVYKWDYFGIPQANYLALDKNDKSRMFSEYYKKLFLKYFDGQKIYFFLLFGIFWTLCLCMACLNCFWFSDLFFLALFQLNGLDLLK